MARTGIWATGSNAVRLREHRVLNDAIDRAVTAGDRLAQGLSEFELFAQVNPEHRHLCEVLQQYDVETWDAIRTLTVVDGYVFLVSRYGVRTTSKTPIGFINSEVRRKIRAGMRGCRL